MKLVCTFFPKILFIFVKKVQETYDYNLEVGVVINIIIGGLFLLAFELGRYFFSDYYEPRCNAKILGGRSLYPLSKYPFGWFIPTLKYNEDEMMTTHGMDVVIYLKILRTLLFIVIFEMTYGVVILFPVNFTGKTMHSKKILIFHFFF